MFVIPVMAIPCVCFFGKNIMHLRSVCYAMWTSMYGLHSIIDSVLRFRRDRFYGMHVQMSSVIR